RDSPDPAQRYRVPVGGSAVRGPADAKVTLVMVTDFECPYCKRVQLTLRALERRYGADLRIVVKHNPLAFHSRARPAALAAEAAHEQGKFWELHDLLYENSRSLSDEDIRRWAKKAGCDMSRFRTDQRSASLARRVDEDIALAKRVGARGTPAFFVNGRFLSGAQPQEAFAKVIDEEVKEADRRIAAGTPQDFVYAALMKGAKVGV
ncbi:MAG: thioredoxin domain-containing protein, partial [Nannocystaceae bacterium]|nr:thioredoxin domain-containing protein [Nannocystaceae bacterium]